MKVATQTSTTMPICSARIMASACTLTALRHHSKEPMTVTPDKPAKDAAHIDWAEKAGLENLKGRLATGDVLLTQANQLLTLLFAGVGGALVIGNKIFTTPGPVEWGAMVSAMWLAVIAILLTLRCIATRWTQAPYNEPKHLYPGPREYTLLELREFELDNIQERIQLMKTRNQSVAYWLDRCRYLTAATPLVYALGAYITAI